MSIPPHYKETSKWVQAKPLLSDVTQQAPWWTLYQDPTLNALEEKLNCDNQQLKIALSRYEEAQAILQLARSQLYPTILGIGNVVRQQNSATVANSNDLPILLYNTFILTSTLTYEIDAWGQVRNTVLASDKLAKASQLDMIAMGLSLHALLANTYFQLRGEDKIIALLSQKIEAYKKVLYLTKQRHHEGTVSVMDVDEAVTLLENTKTLMADSRLKRSQFEHAIAVLVGEIPANFHIASTHLSIRSVTISPDLPATLLARRPDVAAAIFRVEAANANIGVARAAFLPQLNLIGMMGYQSSELSNLLSAPSFIWSLGPPTSLIIAQPEMSQVLFDGFNLQAQLKKATAKYVETVNAYRQIALTAFQEVEDSLVAIRELDKEKRTQMTSAIAAKSAWHQSIQRYRGGIDTFLNISVTENRALDAELALLSIQVRRQTASIQLIKALGGGWQTPPPQKTAVTLPQVILQEIRS